jgi:hypothetical protein
LPPSGRCIVDLTRMLAFAVTCATALMLGVARPAAAEIDGQLASVRVEPAPRPHDSPTTLDFVAILPMWRGALEDALARLRIFSPSAPRRLSLSVRVIEFSLSGKILVVLARYELFGNPPGAPVFGADIPTNQGMSSLATGVTSLEDPAVVTQNRTEVIRTVQDNITQFIDQLEAYAGGRPRSVGPHG